MTTWLRFAGGCRNAGIVGSRSVATPCQSGLVPSPRKIIQPLEAFGLSPRNVLINMMPVRREFCSLPHHIQSIA
jgi:hypothetical protein